MSKHVAHETPPDASPAPPQVNDTLMNRLGSNAAFLQRVKTFKEINMNFLATESSAFHLDMPRCLPALFSTRPDNAVIEEVVHKLVSLCVTLNEYPHVRYNQNSVLGARIATLVQDALNVRAVHTGLGWWSIVFSGPPPTGRLIETTPTHPYTHDHINTGVRGAVGGLVVPRAAGPHGAGPRDAAHPRPGGGPPDAAHPRAHLPGRLYACSKLVVRGEEEAWTDITLPPPNVCVSRRRSCRTC